MRELFLRNKQIQILWFRVKQGIDAWRILVLWGRLLLQAIKPRILHKYPHTVQMPITYKCNFDCVMCGMRHLINRKDFTAEELSLILNNKLFSKVKSVSVNGGEPFLKNDLVECVKVVIGTLPRLELITIISNGYFTDKMCERLEQIHTVCSKSNIRLHLSLSIDGIGEMQNFHRGNKHSWEHIKNTIGKLRTDMTKYCDDINIISTITRYNIYSISDVEEWSRQMNIPVAYNIATENVRIDNFDKINKFSIFEDKAARQMALEFFYCKFIETKSCRYFGIYHYIKTRERIASCPCDNNSWVTLTPNCQLGYCATHSKELGNVLENSAYEVFNGNLDYLVELKRTHCKNCSHYIYELSMDGKRKYIKELHRIHRWRGKK